MLVIQKATRRLWTTSDKPFVFHGEDVRIVDPFGPARMKGAGPMILSEEDFQNQFEKVEPRPLTTYVRCYAGEVPFACLVAESPNSFRFSKIHHKDVENKVPYVKKVGRIKAFENPAYTYKELRKLFENSKGKGWDCCTRNDMIEALDNLKEWAEKHFLYYS